MSEVATQHPVLADVDDFLAWVQGENERYEFVDGRILLMAGGSELRNDIQVNILVALKRRLRDGPCKPNGSDLLVRIDERTGRFPDVSITCEREGGHAISRPVVVFEVLSPATELADRTTKRRDYQHLDSLRHYILIAQDVARIEVYDRVGDVWQFHELEGEDAVLPLGALEIVLPLAEIYDGVSLEASDLSAADAAPASGQ